MLSRPYKTYITAIWVSLTALVLFAGIAKACEGGGGGGGCGAAPTVSTGAATAITSNSATLNGTVNPNGCETFYAFEYGRSSEGYPNEVEGKAGSGTSPKSVSTSSPLGLQPSTSYHFRLTAWNSGGEITGGSSSFTTTAACPAPTVTTNAATSIMDTSAVLSGSVNPNGCQTTYKIEWGPSSSPSTYPNKISGSAGSGTGNVPVSHTASELQPNTGYHFRVSGTNSNGLTTFGPDKPFTTVKTRYVALGDSFSAGVGAGSYKDGDLCLRSNNAYPELMKSAHPTWTVINATCDNTWTSNVIEMASTSLTPDTKWVTYTVGGNDVEFAWTMAYCYGPELACWPRLEKSQEKIVKELPGLLDKVNKEIKAKAPNAKVIVLNYPKIFNGVDCTTFYSANEQSNLNVSAEMLRNVISTATKNAGPNFTFLDVIPAFKGHAVCDPPGSGEAAEWINGPSLSPFFPYPPENLVKESFHPKAAGQQAYYNLVKGITG